MGAHGDIQVLGMRFFSRSSVYTAGRAIFRQTFFFFPAGKAIEGGEEDRRGGEEERGSLIRGLIYMHVYTAGTWMQKSYVYFGNKTKPTSSLLLHVLL
jgi:hypothetical protein